MKILAISIATVLILTKVGLVIGYPSGAPSFICGTMIPGHPPSTTSGTPPYTINITTSGDHDQVVIQGSYGHFFPFFFFISYKCEKRKLLLFLILHCNQNVINTCVAFVKEVNERNEILKKNQ